jgi:hypothetical protein
MFVSLPAVATVFPTRRSNYPALPVLRLAAGENNVMYIPLVSRFYLFMPSSFSYRLAHCYIIALRSQPAICSFAVNAA